MSAGVEVKHVAVQSGMEEEGCSKKAHKALLYNVLESGSPINALSAYAL